MPRYFFHSEDGRRYPDEDGTDLPDVETARLKATLIMAELLKEQPIDFLHTGRLRVRVTDSGGETVILLETSVADRAA